MASFLTLLQHYTHGTRGQMPLAGEKAGPSGQWASRGPLHLLLDCRAKTKGKSFHVPEAGSH